MYSYTSITWNQLLVKIARYVTHISDELEPNKGVGYGQIGTYVRVHVLFITSHISKRVHYQLDHTRSCTNQLC